MTTLHHEVKINAAPEQVWTVLADLEAVQYYNPLDDEKEIQQHSGGDFHGFEKSR